MTLWKVSLHGVVYDQACSSISVLLQLMVSFERGVLYTFSRSSRVMWSHQEFSLIATTYCLTFFKHAIYSVKLSELLLACTMWKISWYIGFFFSFQNAHQLKWMRGLATKSNQWEWSEVSEQMKAWSERTRTVASEYILRRLQACLICLINIFLAFAICSDVKYKCNVSCSVVD